MTRKQILIAALIWTFIILIIVGIPGNQIPKITNWTNLFQPDKIVHIVLFFPFSWLWASYFVTQTSRRKTLFWVALFGMIYAILTELLQFYLFLGRNANMPDAIADIVGVLVGLFIFVKKPLIVQNKY
jgi:VanZ family protein